jgi:hypothetical protein
MAARDQLISCTRVRQSPSAANWVHWDASPASSAELPLPLEPPTARSAPPERRPRMFQDYQRPARACLGLEGGPDRADGTLGRGEAPDKRARAARRRSRGRRAVAQPNSSGEHHQPARRRSRGRRAVAEPNCSGEHYQTSPESTAENGTRRRPGLLGGASRAEAARRRADGVGTTTSRNNRRLVLVGWSSGGSLTP